MLGIEQAGDFVVKVSADGNWTIAIVQTVPANEEAIPQQRSGGGAAASPLPTLEPERARFQTSRDGSANSAITLFDAAGYYVDLVVNEIGDFPGSQAVPIERAGLPGLDIEAGEDWAVAIPP